MPEVKFPANIKPSFDDEFPDPDGVELDPRSARLYDTGQRSMRAFAARSVTVRGLQSTDAMPPAESQQISLFDPERPPGQNG